MAFKSSHLARTVEATFSQIELNLQYYPGVLME
jgi:hypothetical protein